MIDELEGIWRKWSWPNRGTIPEFAGKALENPWETSEQFVSLPKFNASIHRTQREIVTARSACSVYSYITEVQEPFEQHINTAWKYEYSEAQTGETNRVFSVASAMAIYSSYVMSSRYDMRPTLLQVAFLNRIAKTM
jgi:hypothetical protein